MVLKNIIEHISYIKKNARDMSLNIECYFLRRCAGVALISGPWREAPRWFLGKTPLMSSLINRQPDMTRALLEAGCCRDGVREWLASDGPTAEITRRIYIAAGHRDVIDYVVNTPVTVHRLSCLCRRSLRAQVSRNDVAQLPLPTVLKNYVRM